MRLANLNPEWLTWGEGRAGMGLHFDCPCGRSGCRDRVGVWFSNPTDAKAPAEPSIEPLHRWQRTGDTFEALTLQPSINVVGHWHGWVRNGEVITC